MVCLDVDNYENAYKRILGGAAKAAQEGAGACTVLMLVADDPDAICAARILAWLLKQDNIAYKTVPIANYDDISRINEETIEKSTELKTVVMLNCGSRIDFNDYLSMHDDMVAIVVDSHRPFNLYNIFYNEKVLHLDDGDISALDEVKEAFEALEFGSDGESGDDDDNDGGDNKDNGSAAIGNSSHTDRSGDVSTGQKRSSSERSDSDSESLADSGAWHDDSRHRPQKRRAGVQSADEFIRVQQRKAERRQQKQRHLTILERYYSQPTYHGQSSAVCLFQLVEKLGRPPTFDTIWWAIVGVTSQLWLDRIDEDGYELVASSMSDTVSRVCLVATNTRSTSSTSKGTGTPHGGARPTRPAIDSAPRPTADIASISDYFADIEANGESLHHQQQQQRMTSSKDVRQVTGIYPSREFRFTLLRHWSLHSAMSYSPFVVTRLASWSTRGRSKFDLLMAKLGLSQTEIRQPFAHLDPRLKRQLDEQFEEVAKDFDLADAMYPSFVRDFGWRKAKVSASDAVLALVSLLSTTGARESNRTLGDRESGMQIQIDEQADKDTERKRWLDGFYAAYDALSDFNALEDGIRSAMRLQRAIIEQGTSILERRAIKTLRAFRLAVITEVDGPHLSLFRHPLTLLQLAQFLMSALREQGKIEHAALPFVIAALNTSTDTYIVLGITPPEYTVKRPRHGQTTSLYAGQVRNHFGLIFEETATKMNIQIKQGRFDTSVIEVHRNDLANFADRLRRHL